MSRVEYNKGKLIPINETPEAYAERVVADYELVSDWYDTKLEYLEDHVEELGVEIINGDLYSVVWEIRQGEMTTDFCNLVFLGDGSIGFETQHYNGGGHWTELLEERFAKLREKSQ